MDNLDQIVSEAKAAFAAISDPDAITSSVAAWAMPVARTVAAMRAESLNFTWVSFVGCLHGVLGRNGIVTNPDACIDTAKGESNTLLHLQAGIFQ